ncbi:MAG: VanW family protein [Defluviitaleaceae bacterium]|nr:VanW family protein [Defluviitaleaceae bacterium]
MILTKILIVSILVLASAGCSHYAVPPKREPMAFLEERMPQNNHIILHDTVNDSYAPTRSRQIEPSAPPEPVQKSTKRPTTQTPIMSPPSQNAQGQMPAHETPSQVIGSHETEFDTDSKNRATNITVAAESINGHIVHPGQVFSFNETVGPTIQRRGYKKDIIYVDGEKKKGFGGGVCQVSTTIFNAAESAGMTIVERHDHSRPVGYAKPGKEAATSYGGIDFKFKNEKTHPVVIHCTTKNGKIYATITAI